MHPPRFCLTHKLSDWPECVIKLHCCGGSVGYPVRLLIQRKDDTTFENVLKRLSLQALRQPQARAGLPCRWTSSHDLSWTQTRKWAVELVPTPQAKP